MTRRPNPHFVFLLLLSFLVFQSCNEEPIEFREGHPPPDQKMRISEIKLDSIMDDTVRLGLRVTYKVEWTISPEEFEHNSFRLGMGHESVPIGWYPLVGVGDWTPSSQSIPITKQTGTFIDTATCLSKTIYWTNINLYLLEAIGGGAFLAVASDSIVLKDVRP